jgi:hypothetical protein
MKLAYEPRMQDQHRSSQDKDEMTAKSNDAATISVQNSAPPAAAFTVIPNDAPKNLRNASSDPANLPRELSLRAENVLKMLALELTDDDPPQGRWTPPDLLLERLTYKHLSSARNCGPQTIDEIVRWAEKRGRILQRPLRTGNSLSAMWDDIISRFSAGELSMIEVAEALENSTRRRNNRVPVAIQKILLQLIRSANA